MVHLPLLLWLYQVTGVDAAGNAAARKPTTAGVAAADSAKIKKLKGRVMEDPISDEEDMFAEKSMSRRLAKESDELIIERNKKYEVLLLF